MLTSGQVVLCADARILLEYDEVLRRSTFDLDPGKIDVVMEYIQHYAEVHATSPLGRSLPDDDDSPFLEVALSAHADCLGTGNLKHFPKPCRAGIRVLSAQQFLDDVTDGRMR